MEARTFAVELLPVEETRNATMIIVPFSVLEVYGKKGQVKVRGTIDGQPFRSSLAPSKAGHYMVVRREIREVLKKKAGDMVQVVMELDTEPRVVSVPEDLQRALDEHPTAKRFWENMSYTHQREYVEAILDAKRPETRSRRIQKTIDELGGA